MTVDLPLLVPGIRLATGDPAAEAERALALARRPWVAGFCLFGGDVETVAPLLERLRDAAGRPLFVAADMECGAGQQVRGLRRVPEAAVWGLGASPEEVEAFGALTARDALSVGVDVLFAPVLDVMSEPANPIVGSRAFGWDPVRVAALGAAFARGTLAGGAVPVAKHYPGHGATTDDSHDVVPVVSDDVERLRARDLAPFDAVLAADLCPAVMTAHVVYPALDPTGCIATFSRPILDGLRAAARDPEGVAVFTDALCMAGASDRIGEAEAGRRALRAGCDLLLCPDDVEAVAAGLADLPREALETAAGRVRRLLAVLERAREHAVPAPPPDAEQRLVDDVAARAVALAFTGEAERCAVLVVDDDDLPARGSHLRARGDACGVRVEVLHGGPRALEDAPERFEGTLVVLASVRASKGRGGMTPQGREAVERLIATAARENLPLRVVWCGPVPIPGGVHVPGADAAVERALAARMLRAS